MSGSKYNTQFEQQIVLGDIVLPRYKVCSNCVAFDCYGNLAIMTHLSNKSPASPKKVNIPLILEVLLDTKQQENRDDAYDTLDLLDYSYADSADVLHQVLQDTKSLPFARWYAIEALNKITKDKREIIPTLILLLEDKDRHLSDKAWSILMRIDSSSLHNAIPTLISIIKDKKSYVGNQATALLKLTNIVGLSKAINLLLAK